MPATFASTGFEPCIVSAGAKHDALWVFSPRAAGAGHLFRSDKSCERNNSSKNG